MANKEVRKCRFYVDLYSFYHAVGYHNFFNVGDSDYLFLNPSTPKTTNVEDVHHATTESEFFCGNSIAIDENSSPLEYVRLPSTQINTIGMFNHNFANNQSDSMQFINLRFSDGDYSNQESKTLSANTISTLTCSNSINGMFIPDQNAIQYMPDKNGWSLTHLNTSTGELPSIQLGPISYDYVSIGTEANNKLYNANANLQLGSWFVGRYWDTPHSPNLTLTMTRDFDGIKSSKSISGKTFTKNNYDSPTPWTQHHSAETLANTSIAYKGPRTFQIPSMEYTGGSKAYTTDNGNDWFDNLGRGYYGKDYAESMAKAGLGKKGKRKWQLSFDYLSDTDTWINQEFSLPDYNQHRTDYTPPHLNDNSFQWVWNHTLGGTIPFLFCPDSNLITSSNESSLQENLAICKFDNKSLQVRQVSANLYSLSISIEEL